MEMPTPVLSDLVLPAAFVLTVLDRLDVATNAPPIVSKAPVPSQAALLSSATETATIGVMAVEPAPPPVASVCMRVDAGGRQRQVARAGHARRRC